MEFQSFSPAHPLYRFWIIGNSGSVANKRQARGLTFNKKAIAEAAQSTFTPRINSILVRGIAIFLHYSIVRLSKDIANLLKEIEDPKIDSKKKSKAKLEKMMIKANKDQSGKKLISYSTSSGSGNKYRVAFNNRTHINNPSEITLLEHNPNLYLQLQDLGEAFPFIDASNSDFQELLNNYQPGQLQLPENILDLDSDQMDPLALNIKLMNQDGFKLGLKGDAFSSFTQRMNQSYKNFLRLTPEKLEDKEYFGYDENKRLKKKSKTFDEKKEKKSTEFEDTIINKDTVTRALNFGEDQDGNVASSLTKIQNPKKKKRQTVEEIAEDLKKPYTELSPDLLEVWDFAHGANDVFAKSLDTFNEKHAALTSEVARHKQEESKIQSTAEKMTDPLVSQQNSFNRSLESSLTKDFENPNDVTFNYDAIDEAMNEVTSTTQFFGASESHMNPPTLSYEISMNQYFDIKASEEKKAKEKRKVSELAEETQKFYRALEEQSKFDKQINFNYLIRNYSTEEKAASLYNALILISTDKISMKQKMRQNFGEIIIAIN